MAVRKISFYVAGPFQQRNEIRKIMNQVRNEGYVIKSDWTNHKPIKPYNENTKLAAKYALQDIEGAVSCDIFVLFPPEKGGGTLFAELGAAIESSKVKHRFVVGANNSRSTVFFHPKVKRVKGIKQVFSFLAREKKEV